MDSLSEYEVLVGFPRKESVAEWTRASSAHLRLTFSVLFLSTPRTVPISSLILATDFATLEKSYKDNFGTVVRSGNFKTTVEFKPDPSQEQWEQGTVLMPVNLTKAYLSDAVKGDKLMVKKTTGNFSP